MKKLLESNINKMNYNKCFCIMLVLFLCQLSHAQVAYSNNIKELQKAEVAKLFAKRYIEFRMQKNSDSLIANSGVPFQIDEKQIKTLDTLKTYT